jgi:hypothetical protein
MFLYTCVVGLILRMHCMRPVKYDIFFVHLSVCRITHNIAQKVCLKLLFILAVAVLSLSISVPWVQSVDINIYS